MPPPAPATSKEAPKKKTSLPELISREHHRRLRNRLVWGGITLALVGGGLALFFATRPRPAPLPERSAPRR